MKPRRFAEWLQSAAVVMTLMALPPRAVPEEIGPLRPRTDGPRYTVEDWRRDWPECEYEDGVAAGRVSIARTEGMRWWRITFAPGRIGPAEGGAGWRWRFRKEGQASAELEYRLLLEPGFQFVKGGKLPGLCGGPRTVSGGMECTGYDGWSVRLMWRREGRGEAYVYHAAKTSDYGDHIPFSEDYRFPIGRPVTVRMRVDMNTPGRADGRLRVWASDASGRLAQVVERGDLLFTRSPAIGVDSVLFETFYGGADESWAPTEACSLCITDLRIRTPVAPSPSTGGTGLPTALPALRRPAPKR